MSTTAIAAKAPHPSSTFKVLAAASIGNALEWYDILVYGYFAVTISNRFFPELPMVRSGAGRCTRVFFWCCSVHLADNRTARQLGLACAVFLRPADRSDRPLHPQARRRNAGVS